MHKLHIVIPARKRIKEKNEEKKEENDEKLWYNCYGGHLGWCHPGKSSVNDRTLRWSYTWDIEHWLI